MTSADEIQTNPTSTQRYKNHLEIQIRLRWLLQDTVYALKRDTVFYRSIMKMGQTSFSIDVDPIMSMAIDHDQVLSGLNFEKLFMRYRC